jgi:hypothetical protein
VAGFISERVAGFKLECLAGFVGIRTADPIADEAGILAGRKAALMATAPGKQKRARRFGGYLEIVIDRLSGLFGEFEPNRTAGLLLPHRGTVERISRRGDILDLEGNNITATQLAVDRQIEHRKIAGAAFDLKLGAD